MNSKISDLKRGNLKAKRQILVYQKGPKGKVLTRKQEEVNPYDVNITIKTNNSRSLFP